MSVLASLQRWLPQARNNEPWPITLGQRRIFILPTGTGLLYCTVLALMLIGAVNYNLSLGHALVFLLAATGMVAMVHTHRNLLRLRLTTGRAETVFAGETALFRVALENTQPQARIALELSFEGHEAVSVSLGGEESTTVSIPYATLRRGRLQPGRLTVATRYPLGLFRAWSVPHPALSCLVYPKPIETPLPPPGAFAADGLAHGPFGREDFSGLRLYQPNDPPRHIAWKAVARDIASRPLLIKQFSGGSDDVLWLDWAQIDTGVDLETRLSLLTGWVIMADRSQLRFGLRLPEREWAPAHGAAHRDACLEALADYGQTD